MIKHAGGKANKKSKTRTHRLTKLQKQQTNVVKPSTKQCNQQPFNLDSDELQFMNMDMQPQHLKANSEAHNNVTNTQNNIQITHNSQLHSDIQSNMEQQSESIFANSHGYVWNNNRYDLMQNAQDMFEGCFSPPTTIPSKQPKPITEANTTSINIDNVIEPVNPAMKAISENNIFTGQLQTAEILNSTSTPGGSTAQPPVATTMKEFTVPLLINDLDDIAIRTIMRIFFAGVTELALTALKNYKNM